MQEVMEVAPRRKNLTATATIDKASKILGVLVAQASSSPTLKVADAAGTIMNTLSPVAGQFYPMPCMVRGDITVTIGGTVDCTVFYG